MKNRFNKIWRTKSTKINYCYFCKNRIESLKHFIKARVFDNTSYALNFCSDACLNFYILKNV